MKTTEKLPEMNFVNLPYSRSQGLWCLLDNKGVLTSDSYCRSGQYCFDNGGFQDDFVHVATYEELVDSLDFYWDGDRNLYADDPLFVSEWLGNFIYEYNHAE